MLQFLALIGFSVRIYLIASWDGAIQKQDPGTKTISLSPRARCYLGRNTFTDPARWGTPLVSWASLILMGWLIFGQKTLMQRIEQGP